MEALKNIGFLGLGQMGGPMAERLLGQSFSFHVYGPSPGALAPFVPGGAVVHDSPRAAADAASVAIIEKDLSLGLDEAQLLNVALPTICRARDVWHAAYDAGRGKGDFTSILECVCDANGPQVRGAVRKASVKQA